jgi:predicted TIM-barrel fold metal-dependent hydrolase
MDPRPLATEAPLDPDLPIVDTHHHLYDRISVESARIAGGRQRYLLEELLADIDASGHNVVATVHADADAMYRADGPPELRVIGETEFINGQAAMSASGVYGPCRVAAGIVGTTDLRLGDRVRAVLEAHVAAGGGRFRGIRQTGAWDDDPAIFGGMFPVGEGLYLGREFQRGFRHLAPLGLSFDAFVLATQLADVTALARAFPETTIVLDHCGGPVGVGRYQGRRDELHPAWEQEIRRLAECPNVSVKVGGLGSFLGGFASFGADPAVPSEVLAAEWRPWVEPCIEAFGADRCMFESNYPVDYGSGAYGTIWNASKRITAGCSPSERAALFSGTAARIYQLALPQLARV